MLQNILPGTANEKTMWGEDRSPIHFLSIGIAWRLHWLDFPFHFWKRDHRGFPWWSWACSEEREVTFQKSLNTREKGQNEDVVFVFYKHSSCTRVLRDLERNSKLSGNVLFMNEINLFSSPIMTDHSAVEQIM